MMDSLTCAQYQIRNDTRNVRGGGLQSSYSREYKAYTQGMKCRARPSLRKGYLCQEGGESCKPYERERSVGYQMALSREKERSGRNKKGQENSGGATVGIFGEVRRVLRIWEGRGNKAEG